MNKPKTGLKVSVVASIVILLSACAATTKETPDQSFNDQPSALNSSESKKLCPKVESPKCDCGKALSIYPIMGAVEWVTLQPQGVRQRARVDTGATTSSIGVSKIMTFERDGQPWVKFTVVSRENSKQFEFIKPLVRTIKIKRHNAEPVERPVVKLPLQIGSNKHTVEVTLADRAKFTYPVLIGRNLISENYLVDVTKKYNVLSK